MYALLGQSQVIQKVGLISQPQWELDIMLFLNLESRALTDPTEIDLPYLRLLQGGGGYLSMVWKSAWPYWNFLW